MSGINLPVITVIIRAFNAEKYVKESLTSVINQTYQGIIEAIICYDEGSEDHTLESLNNFINNITPFNNRVVKIIKHEHTTPFRALLNYGFKNASGAYIAILDYDNIYPEDRIDMLVRRAAETNASFLFTHNIFFDDATGQVLGKTAIPKNPYDIHTLIMGNYIDGNTIFLRKDCKEAVQRKLEKLTHRLYDFIFEDWLISLLAMRFCKPCYVKETYTYYRHHAFNLTGVSVRDPRTIIFSVIRDIATLMAFYELENSSLSKKELKALERSMSRCIIRLFRIIGSFSPRLKLFKIVSEVLDILKAKRKR